MSTAITPAQAAQWGSDELQHHSDHLDDVITVTMQVLIEQAANITDTQKTALNIVLSDAQTGAQVIRAEQQNRKTD